MLRFARPYAQALLSTAANDQEAEATLAQLASFAAAMDKVPGIADMAMNPGIPSETKASVVTDIASQLGLTRHAKSFVDLLLSNYRLVHLAEILEVAREMLNRRLGLAVAQVSSAHPLSQEQQTRLLSLIERKLGQKVELHVNVDKTLLGGFVVKVGSDRYDASLSGQLKRLGARLEGTDN